MFRHAPPARTSTSVRLGSTQSATPTWQLYRRAISSDPHSVPLPTGGLALAHWAEVVARCSLLVARPVPHSSAQPTSMRPQIARTAARTLGRRANSSNAADKAKAAAEDAANKAKSAAQDIAENPQVKAAVESANAAFNQASAAVSRVTGPVGDKVGNMLGGELNRGRWPGLWEVGEGELEAGAREEARSLGAHRRGASRWDRCRARARLRALSELRASIAVFV